MKGKTPKMETIINKILMMSMSLLLSCSTLSIGKYEQENYQKGDLSQEELSILNEIYEFDPNFSFEGELISVSKETQIMETDEERLASENVLGGGSIGRNYMTIYVTVSRIADKGNDTFNITATARWKMVPSIRMEDGFAIAWGKEFALESSSITASYKSMGVTSGKTEKISMYPNLGIGYSVEASHYYGQALDWVRINARISQTNGTGNAKINAAYCHRKFSTGGVGINFEGDSTDISFSVLGTYDTMANYTSFKY